MSPSFLASDPGGSAEQALAWFNEEGRDAGSEYGESTSRLNWQQPGTATTVSSGTVSSSRPSRVELAQLPGGAVGGGRVPASFSGRAAASASRYGFSHDYAWLKGQLEYSATQQRWQLRYIPLDGQTDRYGGSLVLESVPELANFRNGDFIQVQGVVTGQNRSATGPAAAYRITRLARLK
ncbi:MAG: hypothetical protein GTO03_01375 [Planctomycetales bacterium]|nr:hypothetical protein [Planctomycetales bacterium]